MHVRTYFTYIISINSYSLQNYLRTYEMYSRRPKKSSPVQSVLQVPVYKKAGGERGMNGNGTGDERTTVLYVRIPFHFNLPVPVLSAQAHLHAYYTIYMYYTFTHVAE